MSDAIAIARAIFHDSAVELLGMQPIVQKMPRLPNTL
jgi:hypothetical protein